MKKRFMTHRMVLGIFNLISIMLRAEGCSLILKKEYKRRHFHRFEQSFRVNFYCQNNLIATQCDGK